MKFLEKEKKFDPEEVYKDQPRQFKNDYNPIPLWTQKFKLWKIIMV